MREYEPLLRFHEEGIYEELFYPMDIEAYLSKCSLWYVGQDDREIDEGAVDTGSYVALEVQIELDDVSIFPASLKMPEHQ